MLRPSMLLALSATTALGCGGESGDQGEREVDVVFDTSIPDVDFEIDVAQEINLPPDFGDLCDGNEDCSTGYCIEGPSGFICTKTCVEECPDGWGCKGVQSGSADVVFVCVPDGAPDRDVIGGETDTVTPTDTEIPVDTQIDTDVGPVTGNACEAPPGVGGDNLRAEPGLPSGDWPDCIVGCAFEANPTIWVVDLRNTNFTGAMGSFDAFEHVYQFEDGEGVGPDIDVIAVKAPKRTMLELAVLKQTVDSFTEPLIYVSDGFAVRTYNSDVADGNSCARTTLAFPYVSDLPIYVVTEEAENYDRWTPTGYESGTVGGGDYGWILRIRTAPFAPTELGSLTVGQTRTLGDESLTVGGETRYYRFYAPGTARPTVSIARRSGAGFSPSLAGMKTIEEELVWQRVAEDGDNDGQVSLGPNGFRPCIPQSECPVGVSCPPNLCTEGQVEYVFAVLDYNGRAGPGRFAYDVTVRID